MMPKTKATAKMLGVSKFRTGRPCSRGHDTYRYTNSGACASCCQYYIRSRNGHTPKRYVFSDYVLYKEDIDFIKNMIADINEYRAYTGKRLKLILIE